MKERLNFAVIGCGMLARSTHIPHLARSSKAVLHTCCDLSEETLNECRTTYGARKITADYHEAIRDPEVDAIVVATTQQLRLPVISAAAKAGKPVYCEKPIANTLEEMREIQKTVHAAGIPFCAGHNRRSSPAILDAHRLFRQHMLHPLPCAWRFDREGAGRPALREDGVAGMSVRINDDWYSWKKWAFDDDVATQGPMIFEMTHFTDLCNWFLAAEPESVVALDSGLLNSGVVIRYKTGEMATIAMCANGTFGYPKELYEIFGKGAAVVVDHLVEVRTVGIANAAPRTPYPMIRDRHPHVGKEGGISGWLAKKRAACEEAAAKHDSSLQFTAEPEKGHAHHLERFVDEIRGTGSVVCSVDEAVLATRVAFAALQSAREGRVVRLDEV